jgi:hypothetical protein
MVFEEKDFPGTAALTKNGADLEGKLELKFLQ